MKKTVYVFIAFLLSGIAFAQSQMDKDFQGYWKLNEISAGGVRINLAKSTVSFSKERESKMTPQEKNNIQAKKAQVIASLSKSHITVSVNNVDFVIGDMSKKGVFVIDKHADAYKLNVAYEDGSTDNMIIYIKDKKLHITKSDDVDRDEMIFTHGQ